MSAIYKTTILAFVAIITMVNPLAVIPSFIALTDGVSRLTRARVALAAGLACMCVLLVFLFAGNYLFNFFGITVPAFQIMGGIVFLTNALRSLIEDDRRGFNLGGHQRAEDHDVEKAEIDPNSIAIVPLAIPMLSGPGAITSVMVLVNLYPGYGNKLALIIAVAAVGVVSYLVLMSALPISRMIGSRGRAVFTKIMSLLLGAIGIQFVINGIKPIALEILKAS